jgi:hypothetical protein
MFGAKMRAWIGLAAWLAAWPAMADESLLDSLGRSAGLTPPTPDVPDFVRASRPATTPAPLPAFAPPPEPKSKVKSAAELKAMDADLEGAGARARGETRKSKAKRDGHEK